MTVVFAVAVWFVVVACCCGFPFISRLGREGAGAGRVGGSCSSTAVCRVSVAVCHVSGCCWGGWLRGVLSDASGRCSDACAVCVVVRCVVVGLAGAAAGLLGSRE